MDSWTERCGTCGRPISCVGRSRTYVHADQFYQRIEHAAVPVRHTRPEPVAVGGHWAADRRDPMRHIRVA